ncbi:MAG: hypothetical protein ACLVKJ_04655 [Acutalibacteraceae bacterium]
MLQGKQAKPIIISLVGLSRRLRRRRRYSGQKLEESKGQTGRSL